MTSVSQTCVMKKKFEFKNLKYCVLFVFNLFCETLMYCVVYMIDLYHIKVLCHRKINKQRPYYWKHFCEHFYPKLTCSFPHQELQNT